MHRWQTFIARHPVAVLAAVVIFSFVTLAGLVDLRTGALRLVVDPSPESLLPAEGEEREIYERVRRMFGSDEPILIVLGTDEIFTRDMLERMVRLTRRLEKVDGVRRVLSLANGTNVRAADGDILIEPFLDPLPREAAEIARLRSDVLRNPLYNGTLVSEDARTTAVLVYLEPMSDQELAQRGIDGEITRVAREVVGDSAELWISGGPHLKVVLGAGLLTELAWMLPVIVGILTFVLWLSLRSVLGVVLPLASLLVALLWTLGTLAGLGRELNLVTVTVPALVLTIGFAYSIHVVGEYYGEADKPAHRDSTPCELVERTLEAVGLPVVLTGVTTAAGFLSLVYYPVPAIREFGMFNLLAVLFTMLSALTLVPAVLALVPVQRGHAQEEIKSGWLDRLAVGVGEFAARHRPFVIGSALVFTASCLAGIPRIRVANEVMGVLSPDHPIRADYEAINEHLGGAREMRILIETDAKGALLDPSTLGAIERLQKWLEGQPEVGKTVSIVDYVKVLHRALRDDDEAAFVIPESRSLVGQLLLFGASPDSQRLVDGSYQITNILVTTKVADSDAVRSLVDRIEARFEELPAHLQANVTGVDVVLGRVIDDTSRGQFSSMLMAFAQIYVLMALFFTSFRMGLFALFPNIPPIAFYFGALGWGGVTLNPSTGLVGCLALGIAVDDTIHFMSRFNVLARERGDEKAGAIETLRALIRPVSFTTIGLCLGFLVFLWSQNRGLGEFGMLAALALGLGWVVELTLTPAICSKLRIVTLWDLLRTDLGAQPQLEIPLFAGLSRRQARIFALMSELRPVQGGERLLNEGESGDEMFVIVRGKLAAFVERDGLRRELRTMGRGAVVGEVGHFTQKRSANVEALEDGMLIRFDPEDLERLRRVYPRTGAIVYRNLNRIQAERLAEQTGRLR
jgi:predicted RND superfamily exporter protein